MLVNAGSVWWRLFQEVAAEFPDVTTDYMHIDAAMIFMTTDPARFDVIAPTTCSATSSPTSPP